MDAPRPRTSANRVSTLFSKKSAKHQRAYASTDQFPARLIPLPRCIVNPLHRIPSRNYYIHPISWRARSKSVTSDALRFNVSWAAALRGDGV